MPKTKHRSHNQKGFTIIELLIVILVIGVLSGVLLGVVNSGGLRAKGRDAQRKADLSKLQTALELYFADNRIYPGSMGPDDWERVINLTTLYWQLEFGGYIERLPPDPSGTTPMQNSPCDFGNEYRYNYRSRSSGSGYELTAIMEVPSSADDSPCPADGTQIGCAADYGTEGRCYIVRSP